MKHQVTKKENCYSCDVCGKASGDADGLVQEECSMKNPSKSVCCGAESAVQIHCVLEGSGDVRRPNRSVCMKCGSDFVPSQPVEIQRLGSGGYAGKNGPLFITVEIPKESSGDCKPVEMHSVMPVESGWEKQMESFIKLWCDDYAQHLLDNDENDGERLRESIRSVIQKVKAEGREEGLKDNQKKGEAWRKGYSAALEEQKSRLVKGVEKMKDENWPCGHCEGRCMGSDGSCVISLLSDVQKLINEVK